MMMPVNNIGLGVSGANMMMSSAAYSMPNNRAISQPLDNSPDAMTSTAMSLPSSVNPNDFLLGGNQIINPAMLMNNPNANMNMMAGMYNNGGASGGNEGMDNVFMMMQRLQQQQQQQQQQPQQSQQQ